MIVFLVACGAGAPALADAPAPPAAPAEAWKHFGAPFTLAAPLAASAVLADPAAHAQGPVRFRAEATEVCQKMGCWVVVRDDAGHSIRVTMKDHAFGLDKDVAGKTCDLEGTLVKHAVDPKQVEHFVSEGSKAPPEAGATEAWELVATGVAVPTT